MAGKIKRMFELDAVPSPSASESMIDSLSLTPHLGVTRSVKDAFQRLAAGRFRAVDFLAGKPLISMDHKHDDICCRPLMILVTGIEALITYLGNILKHPTNSRYFTIRKSNRIYRKAFEGFENETDEFLAFLGCSPYVPCHSCTHSRHCLIRTIQAFKPLFRLPML